MQLVEKNNIREYWVSNEVQKENYYFYKKSCDEWRCAINIPFDRYRGSNSLKMHRGNEMDYGVEFIINGRLIRGDVNFNTNELTHEFTTTRIMWALIEGIDEILELKRQEFLDQQDKNKEVKDEVIENV